MDSKQFIENLLAVLPYWQYKLVKPLRQALKSEMGLESYYGLQTLRHFGPLTMTEFAQNLKITKQQATKTIDGLYREQLVQRLPDSTDRRYIRIEITDLGRETLYRIFNQDALFLDKLEDKIGRDDLEALKASIETLLRILPKLD